MRIQRKRSKGWRLPEGAICVTRPGRWGNPHAVAACGGDAAEAVRRFRDEIEGNSDAIETIRRELRGKLLACWCRLDRPCHADVLAEIANQEPEPEMADNEQRRGNVAAVSDG
jgi:hypothetical protein